MNLTIEIWDVGHGGCAVVTAPNGKRLMVDCGHNTLTGWRPSEHYRGRPFELLVLSNYDEDHASDFGALVDGADVAWLCHNPSLSSEQLRKLKALGGLGPGMERVVQCKAMLESYVPSPPTACAGFGPSLGAELSVRSFCNFYPAFSDTNNLSIVTFVSYAGFRILFSGDMERPGWEALWAHTPLFRDLLRSTSVFVAAHHGRESGQCALLFEEGGCKPEVAVLSDDTIRFGTQRGATDWYRARCTGIPDATGSIRKVFTTRRDGNLRIEVQSSGRWTLDVGVAPSPRSMPTPFLGLGLLPPPTR